MSGRLTPRGATLGAKIGAVLLAGGVSAWILFEDWRLAVLGLVAYAVATIIGGPTVKR